MSGLQSARPRLVSVYFGNDPRWEQLAGVLRATAERHCPGWNVSVERIQPVVVTGETTHGGIVPNAQKLIAWQQRVNEAPDGAELLLMDADTFVLGPLDDLWDEETADLLYTVRAFRWPINAGVIALRASDRTRAFFGAWRAAQESMLADAGLHRRWRRKYGGAIGQASFAHALQMSVAANDCDLHEIPCRIWNCESSQWRYFGPATRIVHLVRSARHALFDGGPVKSGAGPVLAAWREEAAALSREATPA